jgi:hypothetical protein
MPAKKTGDPIDSLPTISRRVLERAPSGGRYEVPYTVGRVFFFRGWGDSLGKNSTRTGRAMPTALFQLNAQGLEAARTARQRSRAELDLMTYRAVHESTLSELGRLLEDSSLDALIRQAEALIVRVEAAGNSTAGACAYRDALVEYRDAQAEVTT